MRIPSILAVIVAFGAGPHARPQSRALETCGVVVKVSNGCSAELEIRAPNLSVKVRIPADARAAFPALKSTFTSAQVCVAALPPKPGKSFGLEVRDPGMIRVVNANLSSATPAEFGAGAYAAHTPGLVDPTALRQPEPKYTSDAMQRKLQGAVELEAVVRADGTVGEVRVSRSLDPCHGLDDEAIDAAKRWRFSPATKDGQPVAVRITIVMTFRLH